MIAIMLAGSSLSLRAALVATAFSILSTGIVAWLQPRGRLPVPLVERDPVVYRVAQIVTFAAASGLVWLAMNRIGLALEQAHRSESPHTMVANATNQLI